VVFSVAACLSWTPGQNGGRQRFTMSEVAASFFTADFGPLGHAAKILSYNSHSRRGTVRLLPIRVLRHLAAFVFVAFLALPLPSAVPPQTPSRTPSNSQSKPQQNSTSNTDPIAPLLAQAQDALDRNDFTAAIPLLEKIAAVKPMDAMPHFELGFAYSGLKSSLTPNAAAIAEYRQAISLDPKLAPAHLNLGIALLDSDAAGAAESFRHAVDLLPGQPRPVYLLGEALERSGRRSEAIEQYRAATALAPKDDAILFALARALLADGQNSAAESGFRQLLSLKPDSAPGQLGLAESFLAQQKNTEAIDLLGAYLQKVPDDSHARFERAVALQDLNRFDDSLHELDQLDATAPPAADSLKLRGSIYLQQKKWTDADASFQKALAASPADAQLHLWAGQTKMELRDYSAAEKELRRSLELAPGNSDALRQLVGVYYLSGQYENTLSTLDLLSQREPLSALSWFFRALSCDKLGRKPEAVAAYQKFLELDRGEHPDQEFQAQARLKLLLRELGKGSRR
jgi:tetratricopeptide (TPR) repeat protein